MRNADGILTSKNIVVMDFKKLYKEALERAKAGKPMDEVFPELKESEDERIRRLLVWHVHRNIEDETNDLAQSVYDGIKGHDPELEESIKDWKKCLAYLEKQKEQKPFSQEVFDIAKHEALWGEQPPAEWSEEDEEKITFLERLIRYNVPEGQYSLADGHKGGFVTKLEAIFMLKSLRPQKLDASQLINFDPVDVLNRIKKDWPMAWEKVVWKPSEYQMKALKYALGKGGAFNKEALEGLYGQLKKL